MIKIATTLTGQVHGLNKNYKFVFTLLFLITFSCAPLKPLGVPEPTQAPKSTDTSKTTPKQIPKEQEHKPIDKPPEKLTDDTPIIYKQTIDVGIDLNKKSVVIECPEKKWEFKAGSSLQKTEIETKGGCKYANKTYRGSFIVISINNSITVVNRLSIEDYLKGVVPYEIGKLKQDGFEALKAQAIAARTYSYKNLESRKSLGFDVYADTRDQVYNGKDGEDSLVNEAILTTKDLVIKYNGSLIEAFYHSTCGGITDSPEVWNQESKPYLVSVSDSSEGRAFCSNSKYTNWEEKFSNAELAGLFQKNLTNAKADKNFSFSKVEQIIVTEKFGSGRIKRLVVFTNNGSFEVYGDRVRWLFAKNGKILPSSKFVISQNKTDLTINGSGYGHGIGMCQMGAIERAKQGQSFEEILKAYYTNVKIESITD